jgi:hypothetical protein
MEMTNNKMKIYIFAAKNLFRYYNLSLMIFHAAVLDSFVT